MNYNVESLERLFRAVSLLKTEKECTAFFTDLCTMNEMLSMAQRLDTAILLDRKQNYQDISKEVGVSTATISRVSRCLNYGTGGYQTVIDRLRENGEEL